MNIKGKYYIYPENPDSIEELLPIINSKFENSFKVKNQHLVSENVGITEQGLEIVKMFGKQNQCNVLVSWVSDDISQMGFDLYMSNPRDEINFSRNLTPNPMLITNFLILCGMEKLIERDIE